MPKNIIDTQSFLGLTGYFRKLVQGCAQLAKPLMGLFKKVNQFVIIQKQTDTIGSVRTLLIKGTILRIYSRNAITA